MAAGLAGAMLLAAADTAIAQQRTAAAATGRAASATASVDIETLQIDARPITSFDRTRSDRTTFGRLEFRGGLVLTSQSPKFGGLSGIEVSPDGRRFVAVSDEQGWLTGEIVYDGRRPKGLADVKLGPILGLGGRGLPKKRDHDAESVVLAEGTLANGVLLIAFERNHRIGRFAVRDYVVDTPTSYLKMPPETRRMATNKGFEAVAVLTAGTFKGTPVAFAERYLDPDHNHTGWMWINGEPQRIGLRNIDDFDITDAKSLPDGSLIVLERYFRWTAGVKMRMRQLKATDIRPGALLDGEVLIEADMGYDIDNMEGLAVHRGAQGETVLTLVSDDNFNHVLQRTILLQFTLRPSAGAAPSR